MARPLASSLAVFLVSMTASGSSTRAEDPVTYALERRGVRYPVEREIRGILMQDEGVAAVASTGSEPSSHS